MPSSLGTQGGGGGKEQQCCWRGQGRGSVRTPCPLSLLCHTSGLLARVLGCHTPKAAWKVFVGVSVPICFKVVYSVLPGALVNDVYCASLFFVHPFHRDCCSYHWGRTCVFGGLRYTTALVFLTTLRNRIFFVFASWHRIRASGQRSFLGLECLKSYPVLAKVKIQCFQDMTVKKSVQFHKQKICFIAFYLALLPEDSTGYVSSLTRRELEAAMFLLHRWYM